MTVVLVTVAVEVSAPCADPVRHAAGVVTRQGFPVLEARVAVEGETGLRDPGAPCRDYAHGKPVGRCAGDREAPAAPQEELFA